MLLFSYKTVYIIDYTNSGGFLYAFLRYNGDLKKALKYGNASAAMKHSIPGDLNWVTLEEIEDLIIRGSGKGMELRIKR